MRRPVPLVLAALLLGVLACEKKAQTPAEPSGPGAAGAPSAAGGAPAPGDSILVGVATSLTGGQATFGISTRNGIELALDEVNAAGGVKGKKLVTRVYDSQGKPEEAASAVTRLINQDKVAIILGDVASSNSLAMAEKAQAAKVPMITPSSTNPGVTQKGDYIFRVCFIDPFQGFVMAKFARENLKLSRVAVLRDNRSAYSMGLADVFVRKFTEMGGKVVGTESYSQGDTDYRAQLTALKRTKPEAVYVPGYYSEVGIIARQAQELGLNVPLMGGDGWDSEKLFELGGAAVEGSYFSNHYSSQDPAPAVQKFVKDYKARYGGVPDALAALAYDAARVAADALKRAPSTSPEALREAIAQTKNFPGVAGTITL
ncbi:MAG TPA: ABC transporter substrate-binding protein, partial [Aggregicoccus sp.]|nr:ABC transporter substrate-binding protein [Aggregicoccus sp.]